MMKRTDLLESVGERVVSDVVEQRRRPDYRLVDFSDRRRVFGFAKERQRATREVVGAECVLESRVGRAGVDEVSPTELANVSEPLKDFGVDERERQLVDTNVVPDRVAQNLEANRPSLASDWRQPFGPAFFVAASTLPTLSKFSLNMPASFFACAS